MAESNFVRHVPCDACGSSDAGSEYSDGTFYCFACKHRWGEGVSDRDLEPSAPLDPHLLPFEIVPLNARGLTLQTLRKWDYGVHDGLQVANYKDASGRIVAQKIRDRDKNFRWKGDHSGVGLYGSWLWKGGGKFLVLTEGELDALSVSQVQQNKYATASLPDGAGSAVKAVMRDLDWVESFDRVVLMFDMDEPGREAAQEVARILTPGKAAIAQLPRKDASDCLMAGESEMIRTAFWTAPVWRPDGIIQGDDVWDRVSKAAVPPIASYPFPELNYAMGGVRPGEITLLVAAVGGGKSTLGRTLVNHWMDEGVRVGVIPLEETVGQFTRRMLGQRAGINPGTNPDMDVEVLRPEWDKIADKFVTYEDKGHRDGKGVLDQIRFMTQGEKVPIILLDHLTIMIATQQEGDDRKYADTLVGKLEGLVKQTQVSLFVVAHLKKVGDGKAHEEGRPITMQDIRSTGLIAALAHNILGLERNQQAAGGQSAIARARVVKNRETGRTGIHGKVRYEDETGRLVPFLSEELAEQMGGGPRGDY